MKRLFFMILPVSLVTGIISAQEKTRDNAVTFRWGAGHLARQDLVFSPFVHTGFSFLNGGLQYTREARMYHQVKIRYSGHSGMRSGPYEYMEYEEIKTARPHLFSLIDLDYLAGTKAGSAGRLGLIFGGLFTSDIQPLNYVYGRMAHFGYYAALGLGGFVELEYRPGGKSTLGTGFQLPFFSWSARSPYLVNDDEFIENTGSHSGVKTFLSFLADGEPVTWNRLQYFDLHLSYTYHLNEKWQLGADYLLDFIHFTQPRSLTSLKNSLSLSATFRF
jgi:hypothetical protein